MERRKRSLRAFFTLLSTQLAEKKAASHFLPALVVLQQLLADVPLM
jgi:hypothetical protein